MSSPREGSPKRKVDPEELTKRLYYQQEERLKANEEKRQKTLKDNETRLLFSNKKLTKGNEQEMVERIYTQQMNRKEQMAQSNQNYLQKQSTLAGSKKLQPEEVQEVVTRMYTSEVDKRKAKERTLEDKYIPAHKKTTLDSAKVKEVNARLCDDTKGKKEATRERLFKKYNGDDIPPSKKLTKAQQEEMAGRLHAKS